MQIPENITKEHLLLAIEKIDKEGIPNNADSQYYDVSYNNKKYPPKLVVSYANIFANGIELDRGSFEGGIGTPCFKLLERNNFMIINKNQETETSFYETLLKFLRQAKTTSLATQDYLNYYKNLKVRVSFGRGNTAQVPWIAFLSDQDTVQKGIYPVYLFYKDKNILILSYGVSQTNPPNRDWKLNNKFKISTYFKEHNLGEPYNYGDSFVHKVYNSSSIPSKIEIEQDLNTIIDLYKSLPLNMTNDFSIKEILSSIKDCNLIFQESLINRLVFSLISKPFVILTGLSGSGKTKLAQAFVKYITANESQYCIIPVGADWTNREPLLGFPNSLKDNDYIKPENEVLDLIINAIINPALPYFLILDEMNLSHVERYFADFLSAMESNEKISLHSGNKTWNEVPPSINIPSNLFIIGTVNIDETTYMFSPKVLDRANVIEFRITNDEMKNFLQQNSNINLNNLKSKGSIMAANFVNLANEKTLSEYYSESLNSILLDFFTELKKSGAEFGYRSASEIKRFAAVCNKLKPDITEEEIIDFAIMQKLLPKLHGSRSKLSKTLPVLGSFCLTEKEKVKEYLEKFAKNELSDKEITEDKNIKYKISFEKICRMYKNAIENGYASYAEA